MIKNIENKVQKYYKEYEANIKDGKFEQAANIKK